jgi:hypothetical protein
MNLSVKSCPEAFNAKIEIVIIKNRPPFFMSIDFKYQ